MPRGNRLFFFAALGLAIGSALLWALVTDLSSVDKSYVHAATDASDHYGDDAERQIANACTRPPGVHEPSCVQQIQDAARENQRREQDLAAQKMTAWWTKVMGVAALIGMTLSAIGVWLILATFRENKRAADAANAANRPWVKAELSIDSPIWIKGDTITFEVAITVENVGNSPALLTHGIDAVGLVGPYPYDVAWACKAALKKIDRRGEGEGGSVTLFPHDKPHVAKIKIEEQINPIATPLPLPERPVDWPFGDDLLIAFVAVRICYEFAGDEGRTEFLYWIRPASDPAFKHKDGGIIGGDVRRMAVGDVAT